MPVRADFTSCLVAVDTILDLASAQAARDAALQMNGHVVIDVHEVRDVDDAALFYLATTLRLAGRDFTIRGLMWPHASLLRYVAG